MLVPAFDRFIEVGYNRPVTPEYDPTSVACAQAKVDPLDAFCEDNPDADECRCV